MRVSDPSKLHLKKKELTQIWKATCVLCDPNTTSSWKKSPLNSSRFVPIPWTRWLGFRRGVPAETVDEDLAVVWVLIHHLSNPICHITVLIYSSSPYWLVIVVASWGGGGINRMIGRILLLLLLLLFLLLWLKLGSGLCFGRVIGVKGKWEKRRW